ncbi:restriction endonuclease subunit S [Kineothrix sp. MSJ-39]|uniref:restriction endonuclease subunit S n=1 Tax=Kineothrix sp. MSJ-39 TaxID=2841533 RepID=UPI001C1070A6|nr:restriction endonuclease subunit S [Kineothrix sp. MSJ-39]MBU5429708.1 restriction endonuclease subunit S [Kineothrix sp. MSJ-39]
MKVKLGDIFEISSGGTPSKSCPEYYGGDVPWVKTGDLKSEYIYGVADFITEDGLRNSSAKMYEEDTVLMAMYGATIGATSILKISACTNQACAAFRRNDKVIPEYLYYFLKSQKEKFVKDGVGGAQPNISAGYLKKVEMELLLIKEQRIVVDILDKITNIINRRNQELIALDELIKARFVEMFGNPVINEKRWRQKSLGEITTKIGSGATPKGGKGAYQEEGITLIRSMNVHNGLFEYRELAHISDEQAAKLDNVAIEENDVLLNITGASVARSCVVPNKILPARVNQHVCIIRCKEYINPVFLNKLLIDDNYQDLLWSVAGAGATREAITKQQVESLQIIMPPVELQNEFMRFCNQVDKSKVAVQKALDETQLLFDSLMQQYFG